MRTAVEKDPSLPPLAWCARLARGSDTVRLLCGTSVETRADAFFEGAWAGPFTDMNFDGAAEVFGSGGRVRGDALVLVPPSHSCDRLHLIRTGAGAGESLFVSNSLPFVLRAAGEQLDPNYAGYARDFTRIAYGMKHHATDIPTRSGAAVTIAYYKNIRITPTDLRVEYIDKPLGPGFPTFEAYLEALAGTTRQIAANAANPARAGGGYQSITGISSGYDSPAASVLAVRAAGCRRALTFARSRDEGHGTDDSGKTIAAVLGIEIEEFARDAYQSAGGTPEAEFLASGMSGEDVIMIAFEPALRKTLYFTGFNGGKVWDKHNAPDPDLRRKDLSGASLSEFRLRVDFVHYPIPFVGARHQPDLARIATSPEMATWSLGGDYDRPLPRRIAEEAGVPRESFGVAKRAATALLHLKGLGEMSPGSREAMLRFRDEIRPSPVARLKYRADAATHGAGFFTMRVLRKLGLLKYVPPIKNTCFAIHSHTPLGPIPTIWAVEKIAAERYATAATKLGGR